MGERTDQRSLGELIAELSRETATLVRRELDLARTELTKTATRQLRHVAKIAVGGALAYAGLLLLLAAAAYGLYAAGAAPWLAALIVGIIVAVVGGLLVKGGVSALQKADFTPVQTVDSLKETARWAKTKGQKA